MIAKCRWGSWIRDREAALCTVIRRPVLPYPQERKDFPVDAPTRFGMTADEFSQLVAVHCWLVGHVALLVLGST